MNNIILTLIREKSFFSYLGNFFQLIFLIIIFLVIIVIAYFYTRTFTRFKLNNMNSCNMKVIETISIGFNNLHILQVNEKYFLIASSKEGVDYLTELNKEDIIIENKEMLLNSFEANFKSYFDKFKAKDKAGDKDEK